MATYSLNHNLFWLSHVSVKETLIKKTKAVSLTLSLQPHLSPRSTSPLYPLQERAGLQDMAKRDTIR